MFYTKTSLIIGLFYTIMANYKTFSIIHESLQYFVYNKFKIKTRNANVKLCYSPTYSDNINAIDKWKVNIKIIVGTGYRNVELNNFTFEFLVLFFKLSHT